MKNWIEVTNANTGLKVGINYNNFDLIEPNRKECVLVRLLFENMDVRKVGYYVKESYDEVKKLIANASNDCMVEMNKDYITRPSEKELEELLNKNYEYICDSSKRK